MPATPAHTVPLVYTPDGAGPGTAFPQADSRAAPETRGATTIPSAVVAGIARQAAAEVAGVGGAAGGVLGLGARRDFDSRPAATCELYGTVAVLELDVGIAFPAPLADTCRRLRDHIRERVGELTGLEVGHMDIEISWLHPGPQARGALR